MKKVKNGHSVKEIKDVLYQLFQENNLGLVYIDEAGELQADTIRVFVNDVLDGKIEFVLLSKSLILPALPAAPLSPHVAAASMPVVGVGNAVSPAGFAAPDSVLSSGAVALMRCGEWSGGSRLVPGHSCRLRSTFYLRFNDLPFTI